MRGSVTTRRRGSLKARVIWLVKVPGVKRPAMELAPVWAANLRMARCRMGVVRELGKVSVKSK